MIYKKVKLILIQIQIKTINIKIIKIKKTFKKLNNNKTILQIMIKI